MNKLTRKQLLIGGLILLFAINLAALGTIIYQNYQSNQNPPGVSRFQPGDRPFPSGKGTPGRRIPDRKMGTMDPKERQGTDRRFDYFVREKLDLDEQQFRQYHDLMENTREEQRNIAMKLADKRNQMMQELAKDEPDQQRMNDLANDIGDLHTQLKQNTIDHFKELRTICRPDQLEALRQLMMNMSHQNHHQPRHDRPQGRRHMNRN